MTDYYALLDVQPSASDDEIRRRLDEYEKKWFYRRTSAPNLERRHEAERMAQQLEEARRVLLDPVRRNEYDTARGYRRPPQPRPDPVSGRWPTASNPWPPAPPHWGPTPNPQPPAPHPAPNSQQWSYPPPTSQAPNWHPPQVPRTSSAGRRFGAYLLDGVLSLVMLGIGWIIWLVIVAPGGQTPAKSLLGMYTVDANTGRTVGIGIMLVRELLLKGIGVYILLVMTSGLAIPLLAWLLWDRRNQQLWDKVTTTLVVDA